MQTIQLSLIPDEQIPEFKRLNFKISEVSLADVLLNGIHPWGCSDHSSHIIETTLQKLNAPNQLIPELKELGYSYDINYSTERTYYREGTMFERMLADIRDHLYFVDGLGYLELVAIAKRTLAANWTHQTVYSLLSRIYSDFNSLRDFLKSKSKQIKLSGYNDINNYDLSQILTLEDFQDEESVLISQALPITNFRPASVLGQIADDHGNLKLTESISHFQMRSDGYRNIAYSESIIYTCTRKAETIRMLPSLVPRHAIREQARQIAERWRNDKGRYCFTVNIETAERMIEKGNFQIGFPNLNYLTPKEASTANAAFTEHRVHTYAIGGFIRANVSGEMIKEILKNHEVAMTGRKEELLEKLAKLAAKVYQEKEPELDNYFNHNHYINTTAGLSESHPFNVINDCDLKEMILAMYTTKHQRGNTVLEAKHNNDTYDLVSLATALIKGEITQTGTYLNVEA